MFELDTKTFFRFLIYLTLAFNKYEPKSSEIWLEVICFLYFIDERISFNAVDSLNN